MSEHRYDIRISESCFDPNPLMVERQDQDNFTRFQTRKRCAVDIAAYVLKNIMKNGAFGPFRANAPFSILFSNT